MVTNYTSIETEAKPGSDSVKAPAVAGFGVSTPGKVQPLDLTPKGSLEIGKQYKLKDGLMAVVTARSVGYDPGHTAMVKWKKGILQDDNRLAWSPVVEAVEKYVEEFIFNNLDKEDK